MPKINRLHLRAYCIGNQTADEAKNSDLQIVS